MSLDDGRLSFKVQKRGAGVGRVGRGRRLVRLLPGDGLECTLARQQSSDPRLDISFTVQPSTGSHDKYLAIWVSTDCERVDIELQDMVNGKVWRTTATAG